MADTDKHMVDADIRVDGNEFFSYVLGELCSYEAISAPGSVHGKGVQKRRNEICFAAGRQEFWYLDLGRGY